MLKSMEQLHIRLKEVLPILETITDAVFIDNNEGICLWCNTTCEELYDIEMEEIQGKTVDELERAGIFSPSVTKRVLQEEREQIRNRLKALRISPDRIYDPPGSWRALLTGAREGQYFDVWEPRDGEIFADCGAYNGQTILDFLNWNRSGYGAVHSLEPLPEMQRQLQLLRENAGPGRQAHFRYERYLHLRRVRRALCGTRQR